MFHTLLANSIAVLIMSAHAMLPVAQEDAVVLSSRTMDMTNRHAVESVNQVFADNILLSLAYLRGIQINPSSVDWEQVRQPFTHDITLYKDETFAFHTSVLPAYAYVVATTHSSFGLSDGYKHSGLLAGDGVCHIASLLYWAAKDAGLDAYAPTNHDFASIPGIPREYGVSIYYTVGNVSASAQQNMYIANRNDMPVKIRISYDGSVITTSVIAPQN
jgi:hypothetical protein